MAKLLNKEQVIAELAKLKQTSKFGDSYIKGDCARFDLLIKGLKQFPQEFYFDDYSNVVYESLSKDAYGNPRKTEFSTSFGRFTRRQLSLSEQHISDNLLYKCSRYLLLGEHTIRVVEGRELFAAYQKEHIADSCMCGVPYVMFYACNPENIKLIILEGKDRYGNKMGGRALLFITDQGKKIYDTIYYGGCNNSYTVTRDLISQFAKEIGAEQASYDRHRKTQTITVRIAPPFPYMDSFRYGQYTDKNRIILSMNASAYDLCFASDYGCAYERIDDDDYDDDNEYWEDVKCSECKALISTSSEDYGIIDIGKFICYGCQRKMDKFYSWCNKCEDFAARKSGAWGAECLKCTGKEK